MTGTEENVVGVATVVGAAVVGAAVGAIVAAAVAGAGTAVAEVALAVPEAVVAAVVVAGAALFADAQQVVDAAQMAATPTTLPIALVTRNRACTCWFIVAVLIT